MVKFMQKLKQKAVKGLVKDVSGAGSQMLGLVNPAKREVVPSYAAPVFNPTKEEAAPKVTTFPEYKPKMTIGDKGGALYEHKNQTYNLSPEQYKQYVDIKSNNVPYMSPDYKIDPMVQELLDYEAVQRAMAKAAPQAPEGIENQRQLDMFNEATAGQALAKKTAAQEETRRSFEEEKARNPPEALPSVAANPLGAAMFAGSSVGIAGGVAAVAGTATLAVTAPAAFAGFMAFSGKSRKENISRAKQATTDVVKYTNLLVNGANNPQMDRGRLMQDWVEMQNTMAAAKSLLLEKSMFEKMSFWVDETGAELQKIEDWEKMMDSYYAPKFFTAHAAPNIAEYNPSFERQSAASEVQQ